MKNTLLAIVATIFSLSVFAQHTLVLKNGEKVKGVVMGIQDDVLSIAVNRNLVKYPMVEVSSLFFDEYVPYDGKLIAAEENIKTVKSGNYTIKYNIKDRKMVQVPTISNGTRTTGVVVVNIVVNQNGNVISAKPGGIGSTTTSEYLYTKAQFAAQSAKFEPDYKGPVRTEGTIEISYWLC